MECGLADTLGVVGLVACSAASSKFRWNAGRCVAFPHVLRSIDSGMSEAPALRSERVVEADLGLAFQSGVPARCPLWRIGPGASGGLPFQSHLWKATFWNSSARPSRQGMYCSAR